MIPPVQDPRALLARAMILAQQVRIKEALGVANQAVSKLPGVMEALYLRGLLSVQAEEFGQAERDLKNATRMSPAAVPPRLALINTYIAKKDGERAVKAAKRLLIITPEQSGAWSLLSGASTMGGGIECGETAARRALFIQPQNGPALGNLAEALTHLGRLGEALSISERALSSGADTPRMQLNHAIALLALERWKSGWNAYERRLDTSLPDVIRRTHNLPRPEAPGRAKGLALLAEQGIGEQAIFSRFLKQAAQSTEITCIEMDAKLIPLVQRANPEFTFFPAKRFRDADGPVAEEEAVLRSGAKCALEIGSLPNLLGGVAPDFRRPYLQADSTRTEELRSRLFDGKPIVGICWRSKTPGFGRFKSSQLEQWLPILKTPNVHFVNLQYGEVAEELQELRATHGIYVEIPPIDLFDDLDGSGALIKACDLVVSTGSTTAQIAGGLGVETWMLLSRGPGLMWYWGYGERTPWFPDMRLYRQDVPGEWGQPVERLANDLSDWAQRKLGGTG